ncbi:MAG TPA: UbiA family prenyltransferase [Steroidobacteraceae bacterium]|nr:UbiA family prenyltransferase [Steroidobacteraceae bacterium]
MATDRAPGQTLEPQVARLGRRFPWLRLLRVHHWLKNLLVGVPLLTAQAWAQPAAVGRLGLGFLAFSLVASATYVVNDLADASFDRAHLAKRDRPLAAGTIRAGPALAVAGLLGLAGLAGAWLVGRGFLAVLVAYVVLTTLYTRGLKRVAILDVLALGALWTLRIVAGAAAIRVELSVWLLSFGAFLFLSLSLVKRCAELYEAPGAPGLHLPGRGYRREDLPALQAFGIATGAVSVLVLALFVDSTAAQLHYPHHARLWLICPSIWFWLGRIWLLTGRGEMHHDPIVWSLRDPPSWAAFAAVAAVWLAALSRL